MTPAPSPTISAWSSGRLRESEIRLDQLDENSGGGSRRYGVWILWRLMVTTWLLVVGVQVSFVSRFLSLFFSPSVSLPCFAPASLHLVVFFSFLVQSVRFQA